MLLMVRTYEVLYQTLAEPVHTDGYQGTNTCYTGIYGKIKEEVAMEEEEGEEDEEGGRGRRRKSK